MIVFDTPRSMSGELAKGRLQKFKMTSHCASTLIGLEGTTELLNFGRRIDLYARWLQHRGEDQEHFDLFDGAIRRAKGAGATEITSRELLSLVIWPKRAVYTGKTCARCGRLRNADPADPDALLCRASDGSTPCRNAL